MMIQDGNSALMPGLQLNTSYSMEPMDETSIRETNVITANDSILKDGFKIGGVNGHTMANGLSLVSCYCSMLNMREMGYIVLRSQTLRSPIIKAPTKTAIVG
jgi:hypothetical protein